jgi:hypothetical protein
MPLTFPSHAAAILPLLHLPGLRRLPVSALVLGSAAPDLTYLIGTLGAAAHRPSGLLGFCLPAGLVAFLYVEALLLPVVAAPLIAAAPARVRPTVARIVGPRPLPRTVTGWLAVALALVIGAATHQLWDGFTHAWMWPARALYPETTISLFDHPVLLSRIFQHCSSVLGLIVVCIYLARTAPPETTISTYPHPARKLLTIFALPAIVGCVVGLARMQQPHPLLTRALWEAAWSALAWSLLALAIVCLLARCLDDGPPRA